MMKRVTEDSKTLSTQCDTLLPFPMNFVLGGTGILIAHLQFDCCGGASGESASRPVHLFHRSLHGQHCQIPASTQRHSENTIKQSKIELNAAGTRDDWHTSICCNCPSTSLVS